MVSAIIDIALDLYGTKEAVGDLDNPAILQMAKDCGFVDYKHDVIAWCGLFANYVAFKAGYERSGKLNARSWLTVGELTQAPEKGDVAVLWRNKPDSLLGHVGFFINKGEDGLINLIGGNQSDMVNISPFHPARVLSYRKLKML